MTRNYRNDWNDGRRMQRIKPGCRRYHRYFGSFFCLAVCTAIMGAFINGRSVPRPNDPPMKLISSDSLEDCYAESEWSLILVNQWNPIPDQYDIEVIELNNGEFVDKRIFPSLQKMFDAMRADGIYPVVASGYRTAEVQQSLMDKKIAGYLSVGYSDEAAKSEAEKWVAIPGTSEHQLGIAVDINADGIFSAGQAVYDWLDENSYLYGFIHRYPADKTEITGISNEPWHYRYVGIEAAADMMAQNLCLEEYLKAIK